MKKINGVRAAVVAACAFAVAAPLGVTAATLEAKLPVRGVLANVVDSVFSVAGPVAGVVGLGAMAALFGGDPTDGTKKVLQSIVGSALIVLAVIGIQSVLTSGALI